MTYTKEQMEMLTPYEEHFSTALKANWSRHPGREGLKTIHEVFTKATGDTRRLNDNCNTCILNLIRDCGLVYFYTQFKNGDLKVDERLFGILSKHYNLSVVTTTEIKGKEVKRKKVAVKMNNIKE